MPDGPLRVLLDQNIAEEVTVWLREKRPRWTVEHVKQVGLGGRPDPEIFRWAKLNEAIVVTYDEDFADARLFPLGSHHGIIRLRVWPTTVEETRKALDRLIAQVPKSELPGSLVIIDPAKIRLRQARAET